MPKQHRKFLGFFSRNATVTVCRDILSFLCNVLLRLCWCTAYSKNCGLLILIYPTIIMTAIRHITHGQPHFSRHVRKNSIGSVSMKKSSRAFSHSYSSSCSSSSFPFPHLTYPLNNTHAQANAQNNNTNHSHTNNSADPKCKRGLFATDGTEEETASWIERQQQDAFERFEERYEVVQEILPRSATSTATTITASSSCNSHSSNNNHNDHNKDNDNNNSDSMHSC